MVVPCLQGRACKKTHGINDLLKSYDVTLYYLSGAKKGENIHTFKAFPQRRMRCSLSVSVHHFSIYELRVML